MSYNSKYLTMTTSWDDGHPLDLRIADLLAKHGLRGTFYVPIENSRPLLAAQQVRELAGTFEIGAHTVHNVVLTSLENQTARTEIIQSKARLQEITGKPCKVFCFPRGRYTNAHVEMLSDAGFSAARTVELLSLDHPRAHDNLLIIPTSIQAHPHPAITYFRNAMKRGRSEALWNLLLCFRREGWAACAIALLDRARRTGGVFHIWGHSWEIEETGQWQALDSVFAAMATAGRHGWYATNSELCKND